MKKKAVGRTIKAKLDYNKVHNWRLPQLVDETHEKGYCHRPPPAYSRNKNKRKKYRILSNSSGL